MNALARLARVAEENINSHSSGQSSLPPPSGGNPATSLFGSLNTSQPQQNVSTTQAQTSGLFGNTSQPAQTSSIFGNTTSQPAQTSSLFGNTTSQPAQTSSLFGNTSQPAQTSSLFGNNTSQPAQTTSLFGNTTSQPGQGGGLFGSNQNQAGNNQQQQHGSSLFGGNQNNQSGGGLFGSQPINGQATGGFSGSTNAQQPQPQQTNHFGSVGQSQAQQPQNSLFGGTNSLNKTSSLLLVPSHMLLPLVRRWVVEKLANDYAVAICQGQPKTSSLQCSHPPPASCFRVRLANTLNSCRPYQVFESSMSTKFAPQHVSMIYMKTCRKKSKKRTTSY